MLIIVENNQITGIEKNLLNLLDIDLPSVSDFVNSVTLELASIQNDTISINETSFKVNEIDFLSTYDIKVFDLTVAEQKEDLNTSEPISEISAVSLEDSESLKSPEPEYTKTLEEEPLLKEEPVLDIGENIDIYEEPVSKTSEEFLQNEAEPISKSIEFEIKQNEKEFYPELKEVSDLSPKSDSELIKNIPEETQEELINEISIKQPQPEEHAINPEEAKITLEKTLEELSVKEEPETLDIDINPKEEVPEEISQPEETAPAQISTGKEEQVIEISFEDDLAEISEILKMDKNEFNEAIISELRKAADELGIDYEDLTEWYEQLMEQIEDEKSKIYKYLGKSDYENLHESYHKLKGAALNLRLSKIAIILKKLDELSKNREYIEKIRQITDSFYSLIENESENVKENVNNRYIEKVVLDTIQTYLKTQNEAQFQKDKKYIEKLLNMKIESIGDLEKIIKGM